MHVLVVDDLEENRLVLEGFLRLQNYQVTSVSSGNEAIHVVEDQDIDLVLMDIVMPYMDGYETTQKIKSIRADRYLPVIFVTALSEKETLEDVLVAGGDDIVIKPIDFDILLSKIIAHTRIQELNSEVKEQKEKIELHHAMSCRDQDLIQHFFEQANKNSYINEDVIKKLQLPMSDFSGDTVLVGRRPHGGITVLMGDFTGHGLAAAVGTVPVAQVFFQQVTENTFVGDIARELNRQINILLPVEMFFAATLIELSAAGDRLMVWHGGIPDAYLFDQSSDELKVIKSNHPPLGVRSDDEFEDSVQLFYVNESCRFVAFTDGIAESENLQGEMIPSSFFEQIITSGVDNVLEKIVSCCEKYRDGQDQLDDISLLEIKCIAVPGENNSQSGPAALESVPWKIKIRVEDDELDLDVAQAIVDLIGNTRVIKDHKGIVHTLITEMYNNALDHGVLDLHGKEKSSDQAFEDFYEERKRRIAETRGKFIETELIYSVIDRAAAELVIVMHHNGNAFDVEDGVEINDSGLHGRGMELISAICDSVIYSDDGRRLTVIYKIEKN